VDQRRLDLPEFPRRQPGPDDHGARPPDGGPVPGSGAL